MSYEETLEGTQDSPVPGVRQKPGVVWNADLRTFMAALRAKVPSRIPLVVTSGDRTVRAQAAALQAKRTLGDDLAALYRRGNGPAIVASLMAVPNTVDDMAAVLERWQAQGVYMSQHMSGTAVDLRVRGLSTVDQERIVQEGQALGANVVQEGTPPHIHMGVRSALSKARQVAAELGEAGGSAGPFVVLGLLVALGAWARSRTRRRR